MNMNKLQSASTDVPFIKTDKLTITVKKSGVQITGFEVVREGVTKTFQVKRMEVLAAWLEVEKFVGKI